MCHIACGIFIEQISRTIGWMLPADRNRERYKIAIAKGEAAIYWVLGNLIKEGG